jgi:N-(2-amino-2-carboxyethyl)-L-glutamate synthase
MLRLPGAGDAECCTMNILNFHDNPSYWRPQVSDGVLSAVGRTPLISLRRLIPDAPFEIFAKLEIANPGGSIKDRSAVNTIRRALESGALRPSSTVIESTSGNFGVGLAQACAYYGLPLICVVDVKTTAQNLRILEAYGARVDLVSEPDPETKEFLAARLKRVKQLLASVPNSFCPNQYSNIDNARAHWQTMAEIDVSLHGGIDYLFCPVSTCGTLRGCSEYVRGRGLRTTIVAVDALGSILFGGQAQASRYIPGHGAAVVSGLFRDDLADLCVKTTDIDCIQGCRYLVRREAVLAGGSSGASVAALLALRRSIAPSSRCVLIFPDRGERYLNTIYSPEWVNEKFGELPPNEEYEPDVLPMATPGNGVSCPIYRTVARTPAPAPECPAPVAV